jgi:hypothetical protein
MNVMGNKLLPSWVAVYYIEALDDFKDYIVSAKLRLSKHGLD